MGYLEHDINALTRFNFPMIAMRMNAVLAIAMTTAGTALFCITTGSFAIRICNFHDKQ